MTYEIENMVGNCIVRTEKKPSGEYVTEVLTQDSGGAYRITNRTTNYDQTSATKTHSSKTVHSESTPLIHEDISGWDMMR